MSNSRVSPIEWLSSEDSTKIRKDFDAPTGALNETDTREDGELSDGGSDMEDVDYNILPRPVAAPIDSATAPVAQNSAAVSTAKSGNVGNCEEIYSDEEEDQSLASSGDSDSEYDEPSFKRRQSTGGNTDFSALTSFRNPNASDYTPSMETPSEAKTLCEEKMLSFQQQRKVNNIWADVLQEEQQQQALEKLGSIDVDNSKILVERGPESYAFKPGNANPLLKRKRNIPGSQKMRKRVHPDDSDVSSTGLSDEDMEHINKSKILRKSGDTQEKESTAKAKKNQIISGFKETKNMPIPQVRKLLHSLKGRRLSYFIAGELEERKKQLVVRSQELLGRPYCIRMFIKSLKIERKGGLLIKNQSRRRTPGGVFFYMLRKDSKYPAEIVEQVFAVDKEITMKERKAAKAARRHRRKANLERRLAMENLKEQQQQIAKTDITEEGEVQSSGDESLLSYESESSDSDGPEDGIPPGKEFDEELSNDYLDIHCDDHEFDEL